ncbi:MAG: hypothetical protein J6K17_09835 [Oscillospiraceae bacterium]|nr:hypothetical protein [Oscillospiraceae bacterium]
MIIDVCKKPSVVQKNFSVVSDSLKEYIQSGTQCHFNETLEYALRDCISVFNEKTKKISSIFLTIGIISAILDFLCILFVLNSNMGIKLSGLLIVLPVVMLIIYFRMQSEINARQKAAMIHSKKDICFKYKFNGIVRHKYSDGETMCEDYYCDLGRFYILSEYHPERWSRCNTAYGTIININNEELFILFYCE